VIAQTASRSRIATAWSRDQSACEDSQPFTRGSFDGAGGATAVKRRCSGAGAQLLGFEQARRGVRAVRAPDRDELAMLYAT